MSRSFKHMEIKLNVLPLKWSEDNITRMVLTFDIPLSQYICNLKYLKTTQVKYKHYN